MGPPPPPPPPRPLAEPARIDAGRIAVLLSFAFLLFAGTPGIAHAQGATRGTLHAVWDGSASTTYYIVDPTGTGRQLILGDDELAAQYLGLDRQPVEVMGVRIAPDRGGTGVEGLRATGGVRATARMSAELSGLAEDGMNFVTVLCRFADEKEPFPRGVIADVHGVQYPGVRHYFAELAWDPTLMAGNMVTDWYDLPKPRDAYISHNLTDFGALARDCTAAADDDVDFTAFHGINLQLSGALSRRAIEPHDVLSFGGSWSLTLDGATRPWGMTWLSADHATTRAVVMHEMGHALGWPHSAGGNGSAYDSEWDVMSRGYLRWEPPYGWLSVHTIAQHKDAVGWIAAERRWTPASGRVERGFIMPTALPPDDGYLFARIPAGDSHYTVEVRRQAGHDQPLPGHAVVIHHVRFGIAHVVMAEGHRDPNGEGAQWIPTEEYQDHERGVSIRVDSPVGDGFSVSITRGWRLDIASDGPGRVIARAVDTALSCDSACELVVAARGELVRLEPAPGLAASFSHWKGACESSAAVCEVALDRNQAVTAVFSRDVAQQETLLPPATVGETFEAELRPRTPGTLVEWRIADGQLPAGIHFDPEQLIVRGVAVEAGSFMFTIASDDETGQHYLLDVAPPHLAVDAVVEHLLGNGPLRAVHVEYLDRAGNRNGRFDIGDLRQWLLQQVKAGAIATPDVRAVRHLMQRTQ